MSLHLSAFADRLLMFGIINSGDLDWATSKRAQNNARSFMPQNLGQEDVVGHVSGEGGILHTTNAFHCQYEIQSCMYELERLAQGVPFEVLNQERDSVGIGPCLAAVVAWSESVGIVSLIDKGAVVLDKFLYRRPETAGKRGKDGFVDNPFLGGVIGIVINRDKVIEGFNQFSFRLGGVEVGRCRRRGLRPLCFLFLSLS
jgi:hypothetical protein